MIYNQEGYDPYKSRAFMLAANEHQRWLNEWHRLALCGGTEGQVFPEPSNRFCRLLQSRHAPAGLWEHHGEIMQQARRLLDVLEDGDTLTPGSYADFMEQNRGFLDALRRQSYKLGYAYGRMLEPDEMGGVLRREYERVARSKICSSLIYLDLGREYHCETLRFRQLRAIRRAERFLLQTLRPYDVVILMEPGRYLVCTAGANGVTSSRVAARVATTIQSYMHEAGSAAEELLVGVTEIDPHLTIDSSLEKAIRAARPYVLTVA